jgi:hypothetical protein
MAIAGRRWFVGFTSSDRSPSFPFRFSFCFVACSFDFFFFWFLVLWFWVSVLQSYGLKICWWFCVVIRVVCGLLIENSGSLWFERDYENEKWIFLLIICIFSSFLSFSQSLVLIASVSVLLFLSPIFSTLIFSTLCLIFCSQFIESIDEFSCPLDKIEFGFLIVFTVKLV